MTALIQPDLKHAVLDRIRAQPDTVWTPSDFADLATRAAIDKVLQRLAAAGELRRIDRGLYDRPRQSQLTGRETVPDYRAVIQAVARRDQARVLIDGLTAANDLGLTTAVPARIEAMIDARLRPIRLGNQEIRFKAAAPSRLYWAGRPAMRVVQALHWLQDTLRDPGERTRIVRRLRQLLDDPAQGSALRADLRAGLPTLPIWMQEFLRDLLETPDREGHEPAAISTRRSSRRRKRTAHQQQEGGTGSETAATPTPATRTHTRTTSKAARKPKKRNAGS